MICCYVKLTSRSVLWMSVFIKGLAEALNVGKPGERDIVQFKRKPFHLITLGFQCITFATVNCHWHRPKQCIRCTEIKYTIHACYNSIQVDVREGFHVQRRQITLKTEMS